MPSTASDEKMCDLLQHIPINNWTFIVPDKIANDQIVGPKKTMLMCKNGQMKWLQPSHIRLGVIEQFESFFTAPPAFKTFVTNTTKVTAHMVDALLAEVKQWTTKTTGK